MSRALDMLRAMARNVPAYETNEENEESRVLSSNSFISSPRMVEGAVEIDAHEDGAPACAIVTADRRADVPRHWADGYAALTRMQPPRGIVLERWNGIVDAAGEFLDQWAAEACRCGWSALDVFGCHPNRPDARFDYMGLVLLLNRCEVVNIDADGADVVSRNGGRQRYRRRQPLPDDAVPLWELGKKI